MDGRRVRGRRRHRRGDLPTAVPRSGDDGGPGHLPGRRLRPSVSRTARATHRTGRTVASARPPVPHHPSPPHRTHSEGTRPHAAHRRPEQGLTVRTRGGHAP
ncbi:Exodeoxyribonuclease V beta chain [Actinacidiphila cocklensis]|uniref:Exodeoxyribonuclease V beta chain n=1 Tax=Actinacidiphila cocklensis TaxID=887465 RepID=A0A9W4GTC8_9ACTN|nr:Exodeoxyribonuclease V beta chain [Actinacidiphila cocklensis]